MMKIIASVSLSLIHSSLAIVLFTHIISLPAHLFRHPACYFCCLSLIFALLATLRLEYKTCKRLSDLVVCERERELLS